jgi:hypothetical protein
MTKNDFSEWVVLNCPADVDEDDFVIGLAIGSIQLIEACSLKMNEPVHDILKRFDSNFLFA